VKYGNTASYGWIPVSHYEATVSPPLEASYPESRDINMMPAITEPGDRSSRQVSSSEQVNGRALGNFGGFEGRQRSGRRRRSEEANLLGHGGLQSTLPITTQTSNQSEAD